LIVLAVECLIVLVGYTSKWQALRPGGPRTRTAQRAGGGGPRAALARGGVGGRAARNPKKSEWRFSRINVLV